MNNEKKRITHLLPDTRWLPRRRQPTDTIRHQPHGASVRSGGTEMITHPEITEQEVREYWDRQYKVRRGFLPEYDDLDTDEKAYAIETYENLYISTYER